MRSKVLLTLAMISAACLTARAQAPAATDSSSTAAATPAAQTTTPATPPAATDSSSAPAAQTPAPATPPAAAPAAAPPTWSAGPIDFSGEVSGYYSYNANHPAHGVGNELYNFDTQSNAMDLAFAKLAMSHSPDPVGFELDFGFGRTINVINAAEPTTEGFQYIEQAYVEWKPAKAKGFEIDFGKFSTSAGAEVIEDYSNWNYSHSLLFAWAIPYYHFGVRTSFPVGKHFTGGVQVVNGWNDITDTVNSGKTIGLTGALAYAKATFNINYYTGPMNQGTNKGFRNLIDMTLLLTPPGKINDYINFDYGNNGNSLCPTCTVPSTKASASWYGIADALHLQINGKWALTPRIEWFDDPAGYTLGGFIVGPTLKGQQVKEVTMTLEYKLLEGLLWRLEWRRDWSNQPIFERGPAFGQFIKSQNTATIAVIAFFGPKR
jgi:hypothetical protein